MRLSEVFQSMNSWQVLTALKMTPKMAYKLLKYVKLVSVEYDIADKQRVQLIHELTGTQPGMSANIEPGTPEHEEYARRFTEILNTECALMPSGLTLESVLDAVAKEQGNVLSARDLVVLEPFFTK